MRESNDVPPCDTCNYKVPTLHEDNHLAVRVWQMVSQSRPRETVKFEKQKGRVTEQHFLQVHHPIDYLKAIPLLEMYDGDQDDFEKVVALEHAIFPYLNKRDEHADKNRYRD